MVHAGQLDALVDDADGGRVGCVGVIRLAPLVVYCSV
jgi:hypothetical protein